MPINNDRLRNRKAPLEMSGDAFREAGHDLVDRVADFLDSWSDRPVTTGASPAEIRQAVGRSGLPHTGSDPRALLDRAATVLFEHSLFNGHPRFWGYITSSAAPIGALADLLAATVNPNVGAWELAPVATEIELQTIRWIAELIGYPAECGGVLVSGGNMANFVGFLAGRRAMATWDVRKTGLSGRLLRVYVSEATHTWIHKAADLFGLGTDAIRWIPVDRDGRMAVGELERAVSADRAAGIQPLMVVGTAGAVQTGVVDPLVDLADVCGREQLWFHVDGAYGAMAAALPEAPADLHALHRADSIALDPHKWLYSPLEAGCTLVRDPQHLVDAFSFRPEYYLFDRTGEDPVTNLYEFSMQNSRGFRALKVWLALQHVGRAGYVEMIADDVALARALYERVGTHPELEAVTHHLSITTFRYVPPDRVADPEYLDRLNRALLVRMQAGGEAFVSNAVIEGRFVLRACVVNFRTTLDDIEALVELTVRLGRETDASLRSELS